VTLHDTATHDTLFSTTLQYSCVLPSFFGWVFRRNMAANPAARI
jgi:hypothetical protein